MSLTLAIRRPTVHFSPVPMPSPPDHGWRRAGRRLGMATEDEWRTPPLWGLRDSAPYFHDGRAGTIEEAIVLHGGEALASAQRYRKLAAREQAELQFFLLSLAALRGVDAK